MKQEDVFYLLPRLFVKKRVHNNRLLRGLLSIGSVVQCVFLHPLSLN
jgi:hypothetical protein